MLLAMTLLLTGPAFFLCPEERWYISNAAGMALEGAFSLQALRSGYALEIRTGTDGELPPRLAEALRDGSIPADLVPERRLLYDRGELFRSNWVFRDSITRAVAAFNEDGSGFMEIYNEDGVLVEERSYSRDTGAIVRYTYRSGRLVRAEASRIRPVEAPDSGEEAPADAASPAAVPAGAPDGTPSPESAVYIEEALWTDTYRYTRGSALRSIERSYPDDGGGRERELAVFPRLSGRRAMTRFVSPAGAFSSEFFRDLMTLGGTPEFTTDARGRILTETRLDDSGEVLGTFTSVWNGEQLASVSWETETETRRIEFEYNAQGDRLSERNYRNGILERTVQSGGNRDVEELYLNGTPVLRAVWENGRKISEEALRTGSGAPKAEEAQ
jgi:hypothetical protein